MSTMGASGMLVRMDGAPSGGGGTLVYFACDDCAVEQDRALAAGGKVGAVTLSQRRHIVESEGDETLPRMRHAIGRQCGPESAKHVVQGRGGALLMRTRARSMPMKVTVQPTKAAKRKIRGRPDRKSNSMA